MKLQPQKILIVGGGFAGMSAAIQLASAGHNVDLVEIDAGWRSYGAGITISAASLRALKTIGVLDEFQRVGSTCEGFDLMRADGTLIARLPTVKLAGPTVGDTGGIMRPALAKILAARVRAVGVNVRLGCTYTHIEQHADQVTVAFTDGTRADYQLVIGADGLFSKVRESVFPEAPGPRYTGQGVWRAVLPRMVERGTMFMGGKTKPGVNPVSKDQMYMFVTEARKENVWLPEDRFVSMLKDLLAEFTAPVLQQIRARLDETCQVVYRPLEGMLLPQPWHRGRVLMIGDAVHATTPHLASGAGLGFEDGIVIAEELAKADSVPEALRNHDARRWERCRLVVQNSLRLGEIEISGGSQQEHEELMRVSQKALLQPI